MLVHILSSACKHCPTYSLYLGTSNIATAVVYSYLQKAKQQELPICCYLPPMLLWWQVLTKIVKYYIKYFVMLYLSHLTRSRPTSVYNMQDNAASVQSQLLRIYVTSYFFL